MADYSMRILKEMQKLREGGATDVAYNVDTKILTFVNNGRNFEFRLSPTWPFEMPTVKVDGRTTSLTTKYGPTKTIRAIIDEYNRTKTNDSLPKILVLNNAPAHGGTRRRRVRRRKTRRN